jgi:putative transposase
MSQSLAFVLVHIIFSTKNRMPFLRSTELRSEVHAYLTGTLRCLDCDPLQVGGVEDHIHILCGLSRRISLAELVKNLKTGSTRLLKVKGHGDFSWQTGYGAFSVSESARESVFSYIAQQEMHHRRMSFQDEFRAILNKHGVRFEERYLWE